jgi:hypothetical protein
VKARRATRALTLASALALGAGGCTGGEATQPISEPNVDVVSGRVIGYSFDQFAAMAALDRIALIQEE